MKHSALLLLLCVAFSACTAPRRRVSHAPPEEAAAVEFPSQSLPKKGLLRLEGNTAAAIQLAMDDFLPWEAPPAREPLQQPLCLRRRESYDVAVAPSAEGVMLVRFNLNTALCEPGEPIVDLTTYAIELRTMRILSRETHTQPRPGSSPHQ
jgi:hypothetical protein